MQTCLFLGDSITDAGHLFDPANLGNGYVALLARQTQLKDCAFYNRGHDGFTIEQIWRMLNRDGIENSWNVITLLAGVNDIPVEVYTQHQRIPVEFTGYYEKILCFLKEKTHAKLILVEPFLFDSPQEYQAWHPYIETESKIIRQLAEKYNACFLPTDQILRSAAQTRGVDQITLDGIHLTPVGNQILADLWISAYKKIRLF